LFNDLSECLIKSKIIIDKQYFIHQHVKKYFENYSGAFDEENEKFLKFKALNQSAFSTVSSFWKHIPLDISCLFEIYNEINQARLILNEGVNENPNSVRLREQYTSFCIDVAADFSGAINQYHHKMLIEEGHSFSVDYSFRSLCYSFPLYLRKKILDIHGRILQKAGNMEKVSYHISSSNLTTDKDGKLEIDQEHEDLISNQIMTYGKLRIAFQRAVEGRTSKYSTYMKVWGFVFMIISFIAIISVVFFTGSFFDLISRVAYQQIIGYHWRVSNDNAILCYLFKALMSQSGTSFNANTFSEKYEKLMSEDISVNTIIDPFSNFEQQVHRFTIQSRSYFQELDNSFITDSKDGVDVYTNAFPYIHSGSNISTCSFNADKSKISRISVEHMIPLSYVAAGSIFDIESILLQDTQTVMDSIQFCRVLHNMLVIMDQQSNFSSIIRDFAENWAKSQKSTSLLLLSLIPAAIWTVGFIPLLIFYIFFIKDLKYILTVFKGVSEKDQNQAIAPFSKIDPNDVTDQTVKKNYSHTVRFIFFIIITAITCLFCPMFLMIVFYYSYTVANDFASVIPWTVYISAQQPLIFEVLIHTILAFYNHKDQTYINRAKEKNLINETLFRFRRPINYLYEGFGCVPPIAGYNEEYDKAANQDVCESNPTLYATLHEQYRCKSSNYVAELAMDLTEKFTRESYENAEGNSGSLLHSDDFVHLFHLVNSHFLYQLIRMIDITSTFSSSIISNFESLGNICLALNIICSILAFIWNWIQPRIYDRAYSSAMTLFRRLSPYIVLENLNYSALVTQTSKSTSTDDMSLAEKIIFNSTTPIILLNRIHMIESVNSEVSHLLGFTPEQLLGQPFEILIDIDEKDKVISTLTMMLEGQISENHEFQTKLISNENSSVNCHITIMGMKANNKEELSSYVLILRDESILLEQQEELEKAKQRSEELLYQILPKDIVNKINQGETDITFSVPLCSIIFIDIEKFSEYSSSLTPQQIMHSLSLVFGAYDEILKKYPLLTKIKLIGDDYLCAAGLFNSDEEPQAHAEQIVSFGLNCIEAIEECNHKLESSLKVRVGINSGGPIIAGVFGTDNPTFDILGDTISVAALLQSTDVPGNVKISQDTYDLISPLNKFKIDQQDEIYLKGKGSTMTYLVTGFSNP
jgi:class 3 adenylate cyclase